MLYFNSTIVRLKPQTIQRVWQKQIDFNSTIVRLKRIEEMFALLGISSFQFYNSPIKTCLIFLNQYFEKHFNSTIVRLKPLWSVGLQYP